MRGDWRSAVLGGLAGLALVIVFPLLPIRGKLFVERGVLPPCSSKIAVELLKSKLPVPVTAIQGAVEVDRIGDENRRCQATLNSHDHQHQATLSMTWTNPEQTTLRVSVEITPVN
jgi:hypothetical protein